MLFKYRDDMDDRIPHAYRPVTTSNPDLVARLHQSIISQGPMLCMPLTISRQHLVERQILLISYIVALLFLGEETLSHLALSLMVFHFAGIAFLTCKPEDGECPPNSPADTFFISVLLRFNKRSFCSSSAASF